MANKNIAALTAITLPLAGTESLPIWDGSTTKKVALNDLSVVGSWTPAFTSSGLTVGYGTRNGQFTRIGSLVVASMYLQVTSVSGTLTNALLITGLPYAAVNVNIGSSGTFGVDQFITYRPSAFISASASQVELYRAGTVTALTGAELVTGFYLFTISYQV